MWKKSWKFKLGAKPSFRLSQRFSIVLHNYLEKLLEKNEIFMFWKAFYLILNLFELTTEKWAGP